ncbi:GT4_PimA-like domain containing protein [Candidatus Nanopelagicaceae bacterium]
MKRELVIFNYAMDETSPVLAHQLASAVRLSKFFSKTTVVTAYKPNLLPESLQGITVLSTDWTPGKTAHNIFKFYRVSIPLLLKAKIRSHKISVFSHMTDTQSALISPITRALRVRHVLWYAHTTLSIQLKFAQLFVDKIVTSTAGSCPKLKRDVLPLGQAIDPSLFPYKSHASLNIINGIHIGRLDQSKNLEEIIVTCKSIRDLGFPVSFTQIGSPSNPAQEQLAEELRESFKSESDSGWLSFVPSIPRAQLQEAFQSMDFFIHAFRGSLDKALLEATCSGLPVVTVNMEYIQIFGSWGEVQDLSLKNEYLALSKLSTTSVNSELERRARIVAQQHSLDHWIASLVKTLTE